MIAKLIPYKKHVLTTDYKYRGIRNGSETGGHHVDYASMRGTANMLKTKLKNCLKM